MSRGSRGDIIYRDDHDRRRFLDTLGETVKRTGWRVHAYVLMSNHYHLLTTTPEANLSDGMRWFQGTYGRRYNNRHQLNGHVFQGRFKAPVIDDEDTEHFRAVGTYIHLNPLRAGLLGTAAPDLGAYAWSSYPQYLKPPSKRVEWLVTAPILQSWEIARDDTGGRRRFAANMKQVMHDWLSPEQRDDLETEWKTIRRGWYIGSSSFRDRLQDALGDRLRRNLRSSFDDAAARTHDEQAALRLIETVCAGMDWTLQQLRGWKKRDPRKLGVCWLVKSRTTMGDRWIVEHLEMGHRNNVSHAVKTYREAGNREIRGLKKRLGKLCNIAH